MIFIMENMLFYTKEHPFYPIHINKVNGTYNEMHTFQNYVMNIYFVSIDLTVKPLILHKFVTILSIYLSINFVSYIFFCPVCNEL